MSLFSLLQGLLDLIQPMTLSLLPLLPEQPSIKSPLMEEMLGKLPASWHHTFLQTRISSADRILPDWRSYPGREKIQILDLCFQIAIQYN